MKHQQAASGGTHERPAKKTPARPKANGNKSPAPPVGDDDQRYEMVRQTAYGFYQARGCVAGHELDDWLQAEAKVNEAFASAAQALASSGAPSQAA